MLSKNVNTGYSHRRRPHLNPIYKFRFHSLSHGHSPSSSSCEANREFQPESDANLTRPALTSPTCPCLEESSRRSTPPVKIDKLLTPLLPLQTQPPCRSTTPKVAPESTLVSAQDYQLMILHRWSLKRSCTFPAP